MSALWPTGTASSSRSEVQAGPAGKAFARLGHHRLQRVSSFQGNGDLFYDKEDNLVADKQPGGEERLGHRRVKMVAPTSPPKTPTWSPEWIAGFKQGTFAATFCPSWMLGIVADNSGPANKGKWDVAAVPGGGGNWGGSWLAVPTQSKYPKEAAELAEFLTNAKSQVEAFKLKGPLPTNLEALKNPAFRQLHQRVLQQRADRQDLR